MNNYSVPRYMREGTGTIHEMMKKASELVFLFHLKLTKKKGNKTKRSVCSLMYMYARRGKEEYQ